MRLPLLGREDKLDFQLRKRKHRRVPITVTYMDFADDIALVCKVSKKSKRFSLESKTSRSRKKSRTKHEYRENEIHELQ